MTGTAAGTRSAATPTFTVYIRQFYIYIYYRHASDIFIGYERSNLNESLCCGISQTGISLFFMVYFI